MATTRKYLSHLLQNTGITPACSEEERAAADDIAQIFTAHGFTPEIQEFNASGMPRVMTAVLGIALFVGAVLLGVGGVVGILGLILTVGSAVVYLLERLGKISFGGVGSSGISQNVIAYHKASGPLASPRNRPVVVVAHYDSPRADLFAQMPYATYKPVIVKLVPYMMLVPAVLAIVRLLPFPGGAKIVFWLIAIAVALVPLANAVGIIANRFVLPYTSGSVCNKSSVAAMLGVMDAVAPFGHGEEFPNDVPFEDYFSEQTRMAEAAEVAAAVAAGDLPEEALEEAVEPAQEVEPALEAADMDATLAGTASISLDELAAAGTSVEHGGDDASDAPAPDETASMQAIDATGVLSEEPGNQLQSVDEADEASDAESAEAEPELAEAEPIEPEPAEAEDVEPEQVQAEPAPSLVNAYGNYRFGIEVIRAIGMVPESCAVEYHLSEPEPEPELAVEPAEADEDSLDEIEPLPEDAAADLSEGEADVFDYPADADVDYDAYDEYADDYSEDFSEHGEEGPAYGAGIAETVSAVGASAARFFEGAFRKGKTMLESVTHHEDTELGEPDTVHDEEPAADDGQPEAVSASQPADVHEGSEELEKSGADAEASSEAAPVAPSEGEPAESQQARGDQTQAFSISDEANQEPVSDQQLDPEATIAQTMSFAAVPSSAPQSPADSHTVETVDSLMAEISSANRAVPRPAPRNRAFSMVPDPAEPSINQAVTVNRSSLFDLPDPSSTPVDPFAATPSTPVAPVSPSPEPVVPSPNPFSVISSDQDNKNGAAASADVFETITADAPEPVAPVASAKDGGKRGFGKLFRRKKQEESSMSDWLGVDDDFDAKRSGRDIGSWDNFDGDDWKGGATGADGMSEDDLRDAITSMGDDELLGHDIWFVATGASEFDNAGIQAFLDTHRDKLRGVFLINLESVGAGEPCMLATEGGAGGKRVLKGDKRIMNLVRRVSGSFHREFASIETPYIATDAYPAMNMSLRSLTIAGVEGNHLACSHTEDDLPYRVNEKNVRLVSDVVTEVIRRS